ncbi:dihydropteroate synthase [Desulfonatronovibrio hydrogenovorans]|uniref:dihydropteroate synthase n=1 Tax=Desulfonatronovibrio hydrogenovorans TaxID=53245 RepID=UPI000A6E63E2
MGPAPFLIAGILNVTPDSFFDGGSHQSHETAADAGCNLIAQGADMVDLGGESTRPFSQRVDAPLELSRVLPVLKKILEKHPRANVSIDTYKASVADETLRSGAVAVNDVSGCRFDPDLPDILAQHQPGYVLMHSLWPPETMQDAPSYGDVVSDICSFFEERLNVLIGKGLSQDRIVLDPGIGFGKTLEHNLEILRRIQEFKTFGLPLYLGLSNKSVWGKLLGLALEKRGMVTQVAVALTAAKGVAVHRVHDVESTRNTLELFKSIWF